MTRANRAVAFIFVTVLLNSVGFGIVMPVLPELIVDITADPLHQAALHAGWLSFVYALMQLFGYFTSPAAPIYFPGAAFALSGVLVLASLAMVRRTLARPAEAA